METDGKKPVISLNKFSFKYFTQSKLTLHEISLDIYRGEKILIVGPSGSGKSTIGNCINGLVPFAYNGEITGSLKIAEKETKDQSIFDLSLTIGTVLQDSDAQFVGLSVGEDIAFSLENDNMPQPEMKERVNKVAKMVDMEMLLESSPYQLSGGQKQRTSLAGVMVDDVEILLFDEPLANLDPATGKAAIEIIDDIHKDTGKTVLIIEHRLEDVLHRPVDRVVVVNGGRIVADMSPDELVSSTVLEENGIREPLYVTALKYANVNVTPAMQAGRIDTLLLGDSAKKVKGWYDAGVMPAAKPDDNPVLEFKKVAFSYDGTRQILKGVSFKINKGEMLSIVGRNGAGKTTITKLLAGFVRAGSGEMLLNGSNITGLSIKERAEHIGLVMQNPNQMISETMVWDEVALGLKLRGVPLEEQEERVGESLKICGLYQFRKWPISALSFGQKKRVTIASMLVLKPEILILDEPTAGQDFRHYTEIMKFLQSINTNGITIVLITHDMHLMLEYTPRAIVLSDGDIIADTSASRVLTDSEIIEKANLKETSLYELSQMCGIEDGTSFVQHFIDFEGQVRNEQ